MREFMYLCEAAHELRRGRNGIIGLIHRRCLTGYLLRDGEGVMIPHDEPEFWRHGSRLVVQRAEVEFLREALERGAWRGLSALRVMH